MRDTINLFSYLLSSLKLRGRLCSYLVHTNNLTLAKLIRSFTPQFTLQQKGHNNTSNLLQLE